MTLVVWDTENEPGPTAEINALNQQFETEHPNVKIQRVVRDFNDYVTTVKLAASSEHPPDVLQGNEGYSVDAPLVKAGLILPLDKYASLYDWNARFGSPSVLDPLRWGGDGAVWGKGALYGIAQKAEVVGAFYDKKALARLGLSVPHTFVQFEHSLAVAKRAGVPPIEVGNLDKWPMGHVFMVLQSLYTPASQIRDWTYGRSGASFHTPGTAKAATTLQNWARAGYFEQGFNGVGQEDAAGKFAHGQGLYFITGPWENATFAGPMKNNVGFFVVPPPSGGFADTTGALSLPWHISSRSAHPNLDAAYINFITTTSAADTVISHGDLPATPVSSDAPLSAQSSLASITTNWTQRSQSNTLTPYLDWATPTMGDTLFAALQDLTSGHVSVAQFIAKVQQDWQGYYG
ncbi:MAG: extracellular solute-binding protein [Microbacterium sp.]|nr:extracellular solute-binding protein [Microbacterium sp.]